MEEAVPAVHAAEAHVGHLSLDAVDVVVRPHRVVEHRLAEPPYVLVDHYQRAALYVLPGEGQEQA
eukprot:5869841-Alexandrium_andersonii.AAC.1